MADITKNEISWWKGIIIVIVAVVIWSIRLESKVNAMHDKGVKLREDCDSYMLLIQEDIRIIKNIQIDIAKKLDITVKY